MIAYNQSLLFFRVDSTALYIPAVLMMRIDIFSSKIAIIISSTFPVLQKSLTN